MEARDRREVRLLGLVQGVGLRPWIARRARALALDGEVRNEPWGVRVVLEGSRDAIDRWLGGVRDQLPAGAEIESIEVVEATAQRARGFRIAPSATCADDTPTRIPPDRPVCAACLEDLFDPASRRHRYAFAHCAQCGPRASVLLALPWDRDRTTMREFRMCGDCAREYTDASDHRFHAESIACPACGPRLEARTTDGKRLTGDPIEQAAACLHSGGLVAVKGYGGYHLLCDATRAEPVARLRKCKARPTRPLAVLVPDAASAAARVELANEDLRWLDGPAHAVVVAPRRREPPSAPARTPDIASEIAPRTHDLGLILPVAPVHWLLMFGPGSRPGVDAARFGALVFTSANRSGEPTLHDDADALSRLAGLADLVVGHDRAVARPSDDPVVRSAAPGPIALRLSRGTAPLVLPAPQAAGGGPVVLAVGGDLKAAPALALDGEIVLGEHVGDLASVDAADALEARAASLCELTGARPTIVAHDLHPGYAGTAIAERLAGALGARTIAVQHHHAHAAAVLVEHEHEGPALALVLDGGGFGPDGTVWGGELLRVDALGATRVAHLERVPLPGGDAAVREPWRMAWAWLERAFPSGDAPVLAWQRRRDASSLAVLARAARRGVGSPLTSSCGRLFDAVACLLDLGDEAQHEGELAIALESLAADGDWTARPRRALADAQASIPTAPLVASIVADRARGADRGSLARRFHVELAEVLAARAAAASRESGLRDVALSGGCLQNRILQGELLRALQDYDLHPLPHRRLPPNDGGLAAGQAAGARARAKGGISPAGTPPS